MAVFSLHETEMQTTLLHSSNAELVDNTAAEAVTFPLL
jgi:hypothetical protein